MSSNTTSWSKRVMTLIARSTWQLSSWLLQTTAYLAGLFVLGLIVLSDLRRSRRLQSTTPTPPLKTKPLGRQLPVPVREGSQIIAVMPDGERLPVDSLAAVSHAKAWQEAVGGALVYELTKLRDADGKGWKVKS